MGGTYLLSKHKTEWPERKEIMEIQTCEDVKETTVYVAATQRAKVFSLENFIDCTRYNSVKRLLNVICYVLRFKNNLLKHARKSVEKLHTGEISVLELKSAEELWVQYEQGQILQSPTYKQVSQSLGLFRDDKDLLQLGGRLGNAHLPTEQNHPILLRTHSHFTKLVILDAHEVTLHCGMQATLNQLRTRFWLV